MQKRILSTMLATAISLGTAQAQDIKNLPQPNLDQASPVLMTIINNRQSGRTYDKNKKVDEQTLSEILWVANGISKSGRRTIPTARNEQNLKVFVLAEDGIWLYNAQENRLEKISDENAVAYTGEQQAYVFDAPVHLIYTSSDKHWGHDHAGSASQNVYLYATAKGLSTVVRGLINYEALHKALHLTEQEFVISHQTIGYPK